METTDRLLLWNLSLINVLQVSEWNVEKWFLKSPDLAWTSPDLAWTSPDLAWTLQIFHQSFWKIFSPTFILVNYKNTLSTTYLLLPNFKDGQLIFDNAIFTEIWDWGEKRKKESKIYNKRGCEREGNEGVLIIVLNVQSNFDWNLVFC